HGLPDVPGHGRTGHRADVARSRAVGHLCAGPAVMHPALTIAEAGKLIAARNLSPVELTRICLDRVKALDPILHSFLLVTEERALADARAAEARMQSLALKGPLDGIPRLCGNPKQALA